MSSLGSEIEKEECKVILMGSELLKKRRSLKWSEKEIVTPAKESISRSVSRLLLSEMT